MLSYLVTFVKGDQPMLSCSLCPPPVSNLRRAQTKPSQAHNGAFPSGACLSLNSHSSQPPSGPFLVNKRWLVGMECSWLQNMQPFPMSHKSRRKAFLKSLFVAKCELPIVPSRRSTYCIYTILLLAVASPLLPHQALHQPHSVPLASRMQSLMEARVEVSKVFQQKFGLGGFFNFVPRFRMDWAK